VICRSWRSKSGKEGVKEEEKTVHHGEKGTWWGKGSERTLGPFILPFDTLFKILVRSQLRNYERRVEYKALFDIQVISREAILPNF